MKIFKEILLFFVPVWCGIGLYSGAWRVALPVLVLWSIYVYFRVKRGRQCKE